MGNDRPFRGILAVQLYVFVPLRGQIRVFEDRLDRALPYAQTAVDALFGVYYQTVSALVKAVDGANGYTIGVSAINARFCDYVGQAVGVLVVRLIIEFYQPLTNRLNQFHLIRTPDQ